MKTQMKYELDHSAFRISSDTSELLTEAGRWKKSHGHALINKNGFQL